ncbi:MAG TPA: Rap1a/Tai family immunity protein [Nitrospira sp.]|nr:Rap1a/Tai family immunity protein [Nitrospira sp.]
MKIFLTVAFLCGLLFSTTVRAVDGRTIIKACNNAYIQSVRPEAKFNEQEAIWCYGYINAVIDTTKAYQSMIGAPLPFCFRERPDMPVVIFSIVGIGPSHPPSLEKNGAEMVINVLRSLYPCEKR